MHQARHVPLIQEQIGSALIRAQTIAIFVTDGPLIKLSLSGADAASDPG